MLDLNDVISVSHPTDRPNFYRISVGDLITVYVSYETVVAFRGPKGLRVIKNYWGPTTGKHLNWIDDGSKEERLDSEQFEAEYRQALEACGLIDKTPATDRLRAALAGGGAVS